MPSCMSGSENRAHQQVDNSLRTLCVSVSVSARVCVCVSVCVLPRNWNVDLQTARENNGTEP